MMKMVYPYDHISLFMPLLDIAVSLGGMLHRITFIDKRFDLPLFDHFFNGI
jgi:hypothetical protein